MVGVRGWGCGSQGIGVVGVLGGGLGSGGPEDPDGSGLGDGGIQGVLGSSRW